MPGRSHLWEETKQSRKVARQAYLAVAVHFSDATFHFMLVLIEPQASFFNLTSQRLFQSFKPDVLLFARAVEPSAIAFFRRMNALDFPLRTLQREPFRLLNRMPLELIFLPDRRLLFLRQKDRRSLSCEFFHTHTP